MKKNKLIIFIILLSIIISLTGCESKKDELKSENKINAEIEYVKNGTEIFLKKCEFSDYLKNDEIDWEKITEDNSVFISSFITIEQDLTFVNIDMQIIEDIKKTIINISNFISSKDYDNLRTEYARLFIKFESLNTSDLKRIRTSVMNIYINSINKDNQGLSNEINSLQNEFKNIKQTKDNYISLNRSNDIINKLKDLIDKKSYSDIKFYSLELVEILN